MPPKNPINPSPLFPFLIFIIAFLAYAASLSNGFVGDDNFTVLANKWITDFGYIPEILSSSVWSFAEGHTSNYYRPMMHLVLLAEYKIFGFAAWGYHLFNIIFHSINSVLVFFIAARFLKNNDEEAGSGLPFIAGLIFALNTLNSEAVSWIAAIPELTFTLFFLLSFYLYLRAFNGGRLNYLFYILSIVSFVPALFSKEPAITLPVVIAAYDFLKKDKPFLKRLALYIPYAAVAIFYLGVRASVLGGVVSFVGMKLTPYDYILNIPALFLRYIWKFILPINLNASYVFHPIKSFSEPLAIISSIFVILYLAAILLLRRNRAVSLSLFWALVALSPAFYLPVIPGAFAERYFYLPSAGFSIIGAIILGKIASYRPASKIVPIFIIVLLALYAAGDIKRARIWKDDYTLWKDTVVKSPDSLPVHLHLARALQKRGDLTGAIGELNEVIKLDPDKVEAYNRLAYIYRDLNKFPEAIANFKEVLRIEPYNDNIHYNLAMVYQATGDTNSALAHYKAAIEINPANDNAHYNLAWTYQEQKNYDGAIAHYKAAIILSPQSNDARYNLAEIYIALRRFGEAKGELGSILRIDPNYKDTRQKLESLAKPGKPAKNPN